MMTTTPYANSLFEQPWWLDIVAPQQWEEIVLKDNTGNVIARMPYVHTGNKVFVPKLTQNIGIWVAPEYQNDYSKQKQIINDIFGQLQQYKKMDLFLNPLNTYVVPFRWLGFTITPYFTYRIEDLTNLDVLYKNFNKTAKKNIKYAHNKVELSYTVNINILQELLDKTFSAQKRKNPLDKKVIFSIITTCEKNGTGHYVAAIDKTGNIHSCAYFVYDAKVCYYLLGATDSQFRTSGAQSLVLWDGIQFAASHSKVFDFEGSMVEGIENFFRQFGGRCVPYYRIRKGSLLDDVMECIKPRIKQLLGYKI